ncbi:hypothetical protein [Bradyrhizobium sp. JYMT SZCCT0428]|uniref:hypothetical protein n=1 Tax=Bradyrhizobium sp. JYMT SZCCT0428 TaxID=2807673 RepID=UPI001BAD8F6C|nr:hypothetical protein [Bradyrhizobium sp. JYMT SZCCT0428]MBR1156024.1 hypothetical protein [Bradyrhizobium sp. JYMT SZCCT0428]
MLVGFHWLVLRFLSFTLAGYRRMRPAASKLVALLLPIGASLLSCTMGGEAAVASESELSSSKITITTPMVLDAIAQNTPGYSEGYPAGVPRTYGWCNGVYKPYDYAAPPSGFTAVTGWGLIYPKWELERSKSAPAPSSNPGAIVTVANAKTYVHLRATREWVLVQDQAEDEMGGAHFAADFGRNAGIDMKVEPQPDGTVAIGGPPIGYNDLFWIARRGTFEAESIDGVYVQMDMKMNDTGIKLVANVGADWWRDQSAGYERGFTNNKAAGASNWVELSTRWSTLSFYSWDTAKFKANPPPPLMDSAPATKSTMARRRAGAPTPCLRVVEGAAQ